MDTPYFLWDYQLTDNQVKTIIHGKNETEKLWLTSRILSHARFNDVWKYFSVKEIADVFPKLQLEPRTKEAWQRALQVWGYYASA